VALALAMVLLGLWLPIQTTRFEPDEAVGGLNRIHFMAIPMIAILTFGGLRRRRESLVSSHRETKATEPVLDSTRVSTNNPDGRSILGPISATPVAFNVRADWQF